MTGTGNPTPRVEIHLDKLAHNARQLKRFFRERNIRISAVVKGATADLAVARTLISAGVRSLADSRVANIEKMKKAGLKAHFLLLRPPSSSEMEAAVRYADMSFHTEIDTIRAVSAEALRQNKVHPILLMVEMGDLREGILKEDLPAFIEEVLKLKGVHLIGLGTNFACLNGVIPTEKKMKEFSTLVRAMRKRFSLELPVISGGNSANYLWSLSTKDLGEVNHLRIGEALLLGRETVEGLAIPGLYQDAFRFVAEVIESRRKPSKPFGKQAKNAFGETVETKDIGPIQRIIINAGRQDVAVSGLTPPRSLEIIGASSDHIVLHAKGGMIPVGSEIPFSMNYSALLSAMTSPYVHRQYIYSLTRRKDYSSDIPSTQKVSDSLSSY